MAGRIVITPRALSQRGHPALAALAARGHELCFPAPGRIPEVGELLAAVPGAVGWIAGVEPIPGAVLRAAPGLKVISRNGSGVDNIDLPAAREMGIVVTRAEGANARGVAELAIALMLAAFRHLPWSDARLRAGGWERRIGREATGRTLGMVGCGAIGREVARIALGLGMRVAAFDPVPPAGFAPPGFRFAPLETVLAGSDALSLHCPPAPAPVIDRAALARMRPGAVLVNTARAELVDDAAVLAALDAGELAAYATDVYREEPPVPSALLAHDRVILMPHAGGYTCESVERAAEAAVRNLIQALEGGR